LATDLPELFRGHLDKKERAGESCRPFPDFAVSISPVH